MMGHCVDFFFQRGCEHLDIAVIGFFEQFRKFYIGEMMHKSAQVGPDLNDIFL